MFKFAKYFFILYLSITFIPLLLLYFLDKYNIESGMKERRHYDMELGAKQLEFKINNYLENNTSIINLIINNKSRQDISLDGLKELLKADDVQWIEKNDNDLKVIQINPKNKIKASYRVIYKNFKPIIVSVYLVPLKIDGKHGFRITKNVNLRDIQPHGPFVMEIYANNSLIGIFKDQFGPPPHPPEEFIHAEHPFGPPHHLPPNKFDNLQNDFRMHPPPPPINHGDNFKRLPNNPEMIVSSKIFYLKDFQGKSVAHILLKSFDPHRDKMFELQKIIEPGTIILFAGLLLSLIISYYTNKNFINPLMTISNATKKIKNSDYSFKLDENIKPKEIKQTFENFNEMIAGLKEKEELKNSFIENLTHDLKTPLIAQERALNLISREFKENGMLEQHQLAKGLEKNNKDLLKMITLILESCRIDSENVQVVISDVSIYELINEIFEKLNSIIIEESIQLINNIPKDFPNVKADLLTLQRVFLNLVSNSIENASENGKVEINGTFDDKFITITVEDNGVGISEIDQQHLFDRYYTGKTDERKLGSGLGLYVCKKLLSLNNAEIFVTSEKNVYTRFTIKLPVNNTKGKP